VSSRPLVLCADDDEDILSLVGLRLELAGFEVRKVRDGDEAVAAVREQPPDVAVLDVMMPRRNGFEVLAELRADAQFDAVKVILLSARVQQADVEQGLRAGADAYLAKPFKANELISTIERVLSG
jgi:two-component system phosphate regulon response regulator PhoB